MMKNVLNIIVVIFSVLGFSGCLSPVKMRSDSNYLLNTVPHVAKKHNHASTLIVMPPETEPVYNTTQMAYSLYPHQIAYYEKNRWAETPGQMLLPLIVQTLQNTHYFHAVLTPPSLSTYQYVLNTQILYLQQDYTVRPAMARLAVRAQIVKMTTNHVIAAKEFIVQVPMQQYTPYGGVVAANIATADFLKHLARFVLLTLPGSK